MTHRQHLTWLAWLDIQEAVPSRADRYAIQTAVEVRRGYINPDHWGKVDPIKFVIPYGHRIIPEEELLPTLQEAAEESRSRWEATVATGEVEVISQEEARENQRQYFEDLFGPDWREQVDPEIVRQVDGE